MYGLFQMKLQSELSQKNIDINRLKGKTRPKKSEAVLSGSSSHHADAQHLATLLGTLGHLNNLPIMLQQQPSASDHTNKHQNEM